MQICVDEGGTATGGGGGAGLQSTRGGLGVSGVTLSLRTPSAFGSTGGGSDGCRARFYMHRVRCERGDGVGDSAARLLQCRLLVRRALRRITADFLWRHLNNRAVHQWDHQGIKMPVSNSIKDES